MSDPINNYIKLINSGRFFSTEPTLKERLIQIIPGKVEQIWIYNQFSKTISYFLIIKFSINSILFQSLNLWCDLKHQIDKTPLPLSTLCFIFRQLSDIKVTC
ncbi:hypothetical protein ACTA71_012204 [Dictyostelium dimigraforme]